MSPASEVMATVIPYSGSELPLLEQHGRPVLIGDQLHHLQGVEDGDKAGPREESRDVVEVDSTGAEVNNRAKPANESFPFVYQRRFGRAGIASDSKSLISSVLDKSTSLDQIGGKTHAGLQRKASGALQKQFTLDQCWKQPEKKLEKNLMVATPVGNIEAEPVRPYLLLETNSIGWGERVKSPTKRKRIVKPSALFLQRDDAIANALSNGKTKTKRSKVIQNLSSDAEGGLSLPAIDVPGKKGRVGKAANVSKIKRPGEKKIRPAKRPKLVLVENCELVVEDIAEPQFEPQLVFVQESPQPFLEPEAEVRDCSSARWESHFKQRESHPAHTDFYLKGQECPLAGVVSLDYDTSSSETQTDDDLPARKGRGLCRQQLEQVDSEATESEAATETDEDLLALTEMNSTRQCKDEEEESDDGRIPIDLNVLPELLENANPRRRERGDGQRIAAQKPRRPALKRVEISQQLQPIDQKKAVQISQVVKSLWPIPHDPCLLEAHPEIEHVDPISSNSGKFVSLQHLQLPLLPRKNHLQMNLFEVEDSRAVQWVTDSAPKVQRIRVVQPKMPTTSAGSQLQEILENAAAPLPLHVRGSVRQTRERREVRPSSSEETESDIEHQPRVVSGAQSQGVSQINGRRGRVSSPLCLRRFTETVSDHELQRPDKSPSVNKIVLRSPVMRVQSAATYHQQGQGTSKLDQSMKASALPDSSEETETESDKEIVGLAVNRHRRSPQVVKPLQGSIDEQNEHRWKGSGFLKATSLENPGRFRDRNSVSSSPQAQVRSAGHTPVKSPGTGLYITDLGSTALRSKQNLGGEMASRKVGQVGKVVRSLQEEDRRKEKKNGRFPIDGLEAASQRHREQDCRIESQRDRHFPNLPISVPPTSVVRSPMATGFREQEASSVATPEAVAVKGRYKVSGKGQEGPKSELVEIGNTGAAQGSLLCRMTPRTRKLTDAMQKFVTQKAHRRQWREIDLSKVHPTALIGRTCKLYWPLDDEWYPGVIHDYNPQSKKHRIDYQDDEKEMVILSKERVKLKLTPEEWIQLETSTVEHIIEQKKPDPDELAALAAGVEDHQGKLGHGDLVWAKVKGYPMWPAFVMDEEHARACGMEPAREGMLPLQFFGSYDHCRFNYKKVVLFSKGLMSKFHTKCKRVAFEQGLEEIERYLKECRLPDSMTHLLDDSLGDGVHGAIERQRQEIEENWPEPDDQDFEVDDRKRTARKSSQTHLTLPLNLGSLSLLSLGKVVRDSEHFHDQQYIWPEGFIAVRKFPSTKDPDTIVEYKMQVLRNPCMQSLPMFRVIPADEATIEGPSPFSCWKKVYKKLRKAQEKMGQSTSPDQDKRKQFRSGAHMFGFSNPRVAKLIQALPNARACTKFTNWSNKVPFEGAEDVLPAGYKAVNVSWKHLDRCTVCYLDEEYVDNLLLQCDKCRIMVHMICYGELELPDGDLWLCNLCRPDAPKVRPPCCLCPVTGGALKRTTDGRWAHLMCAMWIPETCLVDVKRMEPVDGINAISKERWKLTCSICKVPYGACIQCRTSNCRVAFHPLCARSAGLCMEVLEEKRKGDGEGDVRLLVYCSKHRQPTRNTCEAVNPAQQARTDCMSYRPPKNSSGCARSEPYNAAARRGRREPEALAAALAKRLFVENLPYRVTGCRQNVPPEGAVTSKGGSLWSLHWEAPKGGGPPGAPPGALATCNPSEETGLVLSMSEKFRRMRSSLGQRLAFGKSAIHGMGVFTKQMHHANDMVIEYAGEVVRPIVADIRERRCYDSLVGAGTYMFRIDDERVVDATHAGSIAHLINHSCEPNCYSRTVTASGEDRIIIFAKRDIPAGEELTYDYRFISKDELLTCYCGCAGCRGSVNIVDGDADPTKLLLPLSDLMKLPATTRGHTH